MNSSFLPNALNMSYPHKVDDHIDSAEFRLHVSKCQYIGTSPIEHGDQDQTETGGRQEPLAFSVPLPGGGICEYSDGAPVNEGVIERRVVLVYTSSSFALAIGAGSPSSRLVGSPSVWGSNASTAFIVSTPTTNRLRVTCSRRVISAKG